MEKRRGILDRLTLEEVVAEMHRIGEADPEYVKGYAEGYYGKREKNPHNVSPYVRGIQAGRAARIREAHDAPPLHPAREHKKPNTERQKNGPEGVTAWEVVKVIALLPAMLGGVIAALAVLAFEIAVVALILFSLATILGLFG